MTALGTWTTERDRAIQIIDIGHQKEGCHYGLEKSGVSGQHQQQKSVLEQLDGFDSIQRTFIWHTLYTKFCRNLESKLSTCTYYMP